MINSNEQNLYWSEKNKPILYGTTAIKVPVGTTIDLKHDARFRVFAKDMESGDLTQKIEIINNNINTNKQGEYSITYKVKDEHNNESSITVPVSVIENSNEILLEKTMYSLPSVDYLNELGYARGNNMDRQIVGIFVEANGTFEIRKISGEKLNVMLQNNDQKKESYKEVNSNEWITIKNEVTENNTTTSYLSVPTVKTLYKQTEEVKYEIKFKANDTKIKPLHYYHQGDGYEYQVKFIDEWKSDKNTFAIIDGYSLMTLIPYDDISNLFYPSKPFESLDDYFGWWDEIMDEYDSLIGISYKPDKTWNQKVKTKYFFKANVNGAGSAYYSSGDHVGIHSASVWPSLQISWGNLHEVGHGYQGSVSGNGGGLPLGEVGVNIFGYYIQDLTKLFRYNESWLNIPKNEKNYNDARLKGYGFKDNGDGNVGPAAMLYAIVNLFNAFGEYKETYSYINKYYREVYFTDKKRLTTTDTWVLALLTKYNVNVIPYIESWGIKVSDEVYQKVMNSNSKAIYYLKELVNDDEIATRLKDKLGKIGIYDLVKTDDINSENLKGNIEINIDIDDISNIKNKLIYINDGDKNITTIKVTGNKINATLPVGVYKLGLPRPNNIAEYKHIFIIVKNNETTTYNVSYKKITDISYNNDIIITTRGYWGENFTPFTIQVIGKNMVFDYVDTYPKSGGTSNNTLFASLTVLDKNNKEVYKNSVNGGYYSVWTQKDGTHVEVPVEIGYKLKIFYLGDKKDFKFTSSLTKETLDNYGIIDTKTNERTYIVTKFGLVPNDIYETDQNTIYKEFKDRLDKYITAYLNSKNSTTNNIFESPKELNIIYDSISKLTVEDQKTYDNVLKLLSE